MAYINPVAKWDLNKNDWNYNLNELSSKEIGRSYSYVNYNNYDENVNYLIVSPGARLEDCTKNNRKMKMNFLGINNIVKHYNQMAENINIKLYLMDADAPIVEDAKLMAKEVDQMCNSKNTKSVTIIGHSKCGAMSFYIPSFFQNEESFKKTNILNVATPYSGTLMASPKYLYPLLKDKIVKLVHSKKVGNVISNGFINFYESISSNSHMDYDIALPNGIDDEKINLYDKKLIEEMFREENISSIKKINSFTNITTGIDKNTLKSSIKKLNFYNIGLCLMGKIFFKETTDGFVPQKSQKEVEKYLDITSTDILSSTHSITTDKRCLDDLLNIIDETIISKNHIYMK